MKDLDAVYQTDDTHERWMTIIEDIGKHYPNLKHKSNFKKKLKSFFKNFGKFSSIIFFANKVIPHSP